jgi:hypothetical protein
MIKKNRLYNFDCQQDLNVRFIQSSTHHFGEIKGQAWRIIVLMRHLIIILI